MHSIRRIIAMLSAFPLALGALAFAWPASAAPQSADTLAAPERKRVVERLHELVERHYAHSAVVPRSEFERQFTSYRREALATSDRRQFSLRTRALVASLRNGHTTFSDPWTRERDPAPLPFTLAYLEGAWIVARSARGSLAPGAVVSHVDGRPIEAFYATIAPYLCASNERARRAQFTSRGFLWPRAFTLTTAGGASLAIERLAADSTFAPRERPVIEDRWLARDSIAYVAIRSFGDPSIEARALELVRNRYLGSRVLIVDVRGNGGGDTPRRLTKTLLDGRPYAWWKEDPDRAPSSLLDRFGAAAKRAEVLRPTYPGRVLLLIDGDCASSCEDFVMPLVWAKRATTIGDTTLGSTGQPVFADLGAGFRVSVGARRAHFPDGSEFEGVGIAPQVLVRPTRDDVASGDDRALAAATALARSALRRP